MKNRRRAGNADIKLSPFPRSRLTSRRLTSIVIRSYGWLIGLMVVLLATFEAYDITHPQSTYVYFVESVVFLALVVIIGVLLASLSQEMWDQERVIKVLDAKHKLSLELSGYHDWDRLVEGIARIPSEYVPVNQTCFFLTNEISKELALACSWNKFGADSSEVCSEEVCQTCLKDDDPNHLSFKPLPRDATGNETHCLMIRDGANLLGILYFILEKGQSITVEQVDIFNNIGDDLVVAIKAGLDRKVLAELRSTETALAERRSVSNYLHDHLGQNLGYLHLKMDQLLTDKDGLSIENVLGALELMRETALESYGIVRGVLETIHPESSRTLTNLLQEHARKIAQRANFAMDFKTRGIPVVLSDTTQKAIFYAFEESLSNVEKHANASQVKIIAEWHPETFALTISDDGVGFNPRSIDTDRHFGLEILNERMADVNGRITLNTIANTGTEIKIFVPIGGEIGNLQTHE